MLLKAKQHNLLFRPHFKTHQSKTIGKWFKEKGVNKITYYKLKWLITLPTMDGMILDQIEKLWTFLFYA